MSQPILNDRGMTLPELLIGMSLMLLALTLVYMLFQLAQVNWLNDTQRISARDEAARVIDAIPRKLRGAQAISEGAPIIAAADKNDITFYTNVDTDTAPEKVRYYVQNKSLQLVVTQPSTTTEPWQYNNPGQTSIVARLLQNDMTNPLFIYLNASNAEVTGSPVGQSDLPNICSVKIRAIADDDTSTALGRIDIDTVIYLRNN
ncbi:MAG TPA: prepilin-type N-terminal cleavage/methylation domain-containing protein [Candidatus Aquicultor sp.]|jgi:prepilin-type N-terminal cleavage/methylation domain-containing protein